MREDRAREILEALIAGDDPVTGAELPKDSPLQHAEVLRALLLAVKAVQSVAARSARRAMLPPNVGKSWSEAEFGRLLTAYRSGVPLRELARRHGRTVRAIQARLELTDPQLLIASAAEPADAQDPPGRLPPDSLRSA